MTVSIIMSYYNRKTQLINTLKTISKSKKINDTEVIIVDDYSSEEHLLDGLEKEFNFIKIIKMSDFGDRWYSNPCIPYNVGINQSQNDVIILQNPECLHIGDIISDVCEKINENNYLTYSIYSLNEDNTNILNNYLNNNQLIEIDYIEKITENFKHESLGMGLNCWYNHPTHRPSYYHFISAITKENMEMLSGFDPIFSNGIGFDDDEFLWRVNKLNLKTEIIEYPMGIHQYHYNDNRIISNSKNVDYDFNLNKNIFENITKTRNSFNYKELKYDKIPKVMNLYWDTSKMSYLQFLTLVSFNKMNPDWKINVFYPKHKYEGVDTWKSGEQSDKYFGEDYWPKVFKLNYVNTIEFDFNDIQITNDIPEVFKSDFIRWYLLSTIGGGWSDFDIIYIRPLTVLNEFSNNTDLENIITFHDDTFIIGFFLCSNHNENFSKVFEKSRTSLKMEIYQSVGCDIFKEVHKNYDLFNYKENSLNLKNDVFYTISWTEQDVYNLFFTDILKEKITNNTIGIHWYNGNPQSKKYLNNFTVYKNNDSTMSKIIKKYEQ